VFLDSETQFKIHDLEIIVSQTDVFIFILSKDYVQSEWCLKELKTAIQHKKKIIIIRDFGYPIIQPFPEKAIEYLAPVTVDDVQKIINESRSFIWIAEYHYACASKLRKEADPFLQKNLHSYSRKIRTSMNKFW